MNTMAENLVITTGNDWDGTNAAGGYSASGCEGVDGPTGPDDPSGYLGIVPEYKDTTNAQYVFPASDWQALTGNRPTVYGRMHYIWEWTNPVSGELEIWGTCGTKKYSISYNGMQLIRWNGTAWVDGGLSNTFSYSHTQTVKCVAWTDIHCVIAHVTGHSGIGALLWIYDGSTWAEYNDLDKRYYTIWTYQGVIYVGGAEKAGSNYTPTIWTLNPATAVLSPVWSDSGSHTHSDTGVTGFIDDGTYLYYGTRYGNGGTECNIYKYDGLSAPVKVYTLPDVSHSHTARQSAYDSINNRIVFSGVDTIYSDNAGATWTCKSTMSISAGELYTCIVPPRHGYPYWVMPRRGELGGSGLVEKWDYDFDSMTQITQGSSDNNFDAYPCGGYDISGYGTTLGNSRYPESSPTDLAAWFQDQSVPATSKYEAIFEVSESTRYVEFNATYDTDGGTATFYLKYGNSLASAQAASWEEVTAGSEIDIEGSFVGFKVSFSGHGLNATVSDITLTPYTPPAVIDTVVITPSSLLCYGNLRYKNLVYSMTKYVYDNGYDAIGYTNQGVKLDFTGLTIGRTYQIYYNDGLYHTFTATKTTYTIRIQIKRGRNAIEVREPDGTNHFLKMWAYHIHLFLCLYALEFGTWDDEYNQDTEDAGFLTTESPSAPILVKKMKSLMKYNPNADLGDFTLLQMAIGVINAYTDQQMTKAYKLVGQGLFGVDPIVRMCYEERLGRIGSGFKVRRSGVATISWDENQFFFDNRWHTVLSGTTALPDGSYYFYVEPTNSDTAEMKVISSSNWTGYTTVTETISQPEIQTDGSDGTITGYPNNKYIYTQSPVESITSVSSTGGTLSYSLISGGIISLGTSELSSVLAPITVIYKTSLKLFIYGHVIISSGDVTEINGAARIGRSFRITSTNSNMMLCRVFFPVTGVDWHVKESIRNLLHYLKPANTRGRLYFQ